MAREPLVHFLFGALLIFAWFSWGADSVDETDKIIIDEQEVERLWSNWVQSWRKPPTQQQLAGLIENAVREEVYFREALRLGLDRGDPVVRNRMVQKMRFLQSEQLDEPSEEELQAWLANNSEKYAIPKKLSFQQIYLGQDVSLNQGREQLVALQKGATSAAKLRQPLGLPEGYESLDATRIESQFGRDFAMQLNSLSVGEWHGPIQSGYGFHFVFINKIEPEQAGSLDIAAIRQRVENDWRADQRLQLEAENLAQLKEKYQIEVAQPQ